MPNTRGVFTLEKIREKDILEEWINLNEVWVSPTAPNTGYFGGGYPTSSVMDKVSYSSDTTARVPGANLSVPRSYLAATGNSISGYFGGGWDGTNRYSTLDKVTYITDTISSSPTLSNTRSDYAATGNSTAGYFGGGYSPGVSITSSVDKVIYSTDTSTLVPGANLSAARNQLAATGNSIDGYFGGGFTPGPNYYSTMDRITYSLDITSAVPGANLSAGRRLLVATGNSISGYFGGGQEIPGNNYVSIVDKVTYSSNTTSQVPGANLSGTRYGLAATGNSTSGYFGGGGTPGTPGPYSSMDKVNYSTDTRQPAIPGLNLSSPRIYLSATSARANALPSSNPDAALRFNDAFGPISNSGYFGGGGLGPGSTMDKVTYSSDTTARVPGANLSAARYNLAATSSSTAGYFGGSPGPVSTMDKITYSSDTTAAVPGAPLSSPRYSLAATGNSTSGYFGGGSPGSSSTMDKVTYSTDTTSSLPATGSLSAARWGLAATGNSTAGYFGGGRGPSGYYSTMDKLTYSLDTTARVPGANLSVARHQLAATGNSSSGYFGGGFDPGIPGSTTRMDKITYSTDTTAVVPGAVLSSTRYSISATGSSSSGYFGGGKSPGLSSSMDKLNYSLDSTSRIPSGNLSAARYGLAATSARANALPQPLPTTPTDYPNTGYFGGGGVIQYSTMDKLNYSIDTTAAVPSANLNVARYYIAATGNSTSGYFGGGTPGTHSTMEKVTYSSDTTARVPGANLSSARYSISATGNSTTGYFGGGYSPGGTHSTMEKTTYASDTTSPLPATGALSAARYGLGATGNSTVGYFGGGLSPAVSPGYYSTMDKVTYSTDTRSTVPASGSLSVPRYRLAATGNSTAGYFGGGYSPGTPGYNSTMDKISYADDTRSTVPGAFLSGARYSLAATGNSTSGYFGGGFVPAASSTMDKITYSIDTTVAVPGAALSVARRFLAASSARANALPTSFSNIV